MYNGRVNKLYYGEGDTAKVHQPLFGLEIDLGEDLEQESKETVEPESVAQTAPAPVTSVATGLSSTSKVLTTPAVRKMAREYELDLATITGTGKRGRVLKEDILGYLAKDSDVAIPTPEIAIAAEDRVEPIKGVRKIMAERMSVAVATIPHFTYVDEMDVTELMPFRPVSYTHLTLPTTPYV